MTPPIPSPQPLGPIRASVEQVQRDVDALRVDRWESLPRPIVVAHRGSGNVTAPENTMAAYRWAAALGYIVEADLQYTADRAIICNHDTTLDKPTGRTDGLRAESLSLDAIKRLDFSKSLLPEWFSPQPPVTFEEYMNLARLGALLAPEVRGSTGEMGRDVARRVKRAGLQHMFLVQAFSAAELVAVREVDPSIRTLKLGVDTTVEEAIANGYWAVSPERSRMLDTLGPGWVEAMQAAGVRVIPYLANTLVDAEQMLAFGVDGFFTDRPAHVVRAGYRIPRGKTTIKVPPIFDLATWPWASSIAGVCPVVVDGFATLGGYADWTDGASSKIEVAGLRTADTPATQTIETAIKIVAPPPSGSTSRYIALRWGWQSEGLGASTHGAGGYQLEYTRAGNARLMRRIGADQVQLAAALWPAPVTGEAIPIRIEMTATTITVTRTDTGHSLTAEDATWRGGFVGVFSGGLIPGIGDVSITY